ncbi:Hypp7763 [Branchiostoma lanceolatum]|uniref:Hypp7763 protein n=1 Tax=Branchiostoma lanceolatum TaxID=7740 RepID=A0A8J9Z2U9_BRALA|nr:Hypp7763 [Branchiostoma lanceolatum]
MVGATRKKIDIRQVGWKDLRCASPDVTVTLDNGTVTGNVSFTCRTVCQEGLLFSWIAPNGDYRTPSYEYSMNYTHGSKTLCKGLPINSFDTRRMCYSVLNIPQDGSDANGTYTCQVTADHTDNASASAVLTVSSGTDKSTRGYSSVFPTTIMAVTPPSVDKGVGEATTNRPGFGLSADHLIFAGLGSFCGCTIVFAVIAACVSKCKEARQMDSSNALRNAVDEQHGTDDGSSDTDGPRGGHYENDDQISGTNEGRNGQYENDDQFSGTNGAKDGQYENEDQFSNTEGATGGQYENDDQISGTKGDRNGQYENEDQFSDTEGAVGGHYENEDQFSDDDVTKHSHKTALGKPISGGKGNTSSTGRDKRNRCSHNKRGVVKTRAMPNNQTDMAISHIVTFHAKAHVTGHYDNERIDVGRNLSDRKATATSASGGASHDKKQTAGHYDNDKNAKGLTLNNSIKTDNDSDSYHDYMSLPENTTAGRETGRQEGDEPCESLASAAESDSDHDYMSLPENKAAARETGRGEGDEQCESLASAAESDSDHDYMSLPENKAAARETGRGEEDEQCESLSEDNNPVPASASAAEVSEHGYVKLPRTENTDDNLDNTCMKLSGTEKADDNSYHTYVKLPGTENVEDNSNHTCVTESVEDNSDHTCVTENVEDD